MMFHSQNLEESWYDTAQICLNGHVITDSSKTTPGLKRQFCDKCGAATITECPKCKANIRGHYHVPGIISVGKGFKAPKFCSDCGAAYPWTESSLKAVHALANEIEQISDDEKNILTHSLDDLVKETPQTEVAAIRVKKIMRKAGTEAAYALREILIDIISETARRAIFGQ